MNPLPPLPKRQTNTVAQLPRPQRDEVNLMVRDGVFYKDIVAKMAKAGIELSVDILKRWRRSGHQQWLEEQKRLDHFRHIREFAVQVVKENEGKAIEEAALQMAAAHVYDLLLTFDPKTLKEKLEEDPMNYARIVQMASKLADGGLKYERYRAHVAQQKAEMEKSLDKMKATGLTDEVLAELESKLKLL